jgi:predicted acyltransferase
MILGLLAGNILRSNMISKEEGEEICNYRRMPACRRITGSCYRNKPNCQKDLDTSLGIIQRRLLLYFTCSFLLDCGYKGKKKYFFILMVIGMNSIAAYVLADGFGHLLQNTLYTSWSLRPGFW